MDNMPLELAVVLTRVALWLVPWGGFVAGIGVLVVSNAWHAEKPHAVDSGLMLVALAGGGLALGIVLPFLTHALTQDYAIRVPLWRFIGWFLLCGVGLVTAAGYYRRGAAVFDHWRARFIHTTTLARDRRTDVRTVHEHFPAEVGDYDPRAFYKADAFFLGLDAQGQPVYWQGRLPHVAVSGFSGAGKGKKLQDLAAQSIAHDELLVYLDPKDDAWGAYAVYDACQRAGKPYVYLRLTPHEPPQFNLLADADDFEIEELFTAGFDLGDTGSEADFYRMKDRMAALEAAAFAARQPLTCADLYTELYDDYKKDAPGFLGKLHEVARVQAANATHNGVDVAAMLDTGGAVYVVGSTTLPGVRRVQQMLFVRFLQLAARRDRRHGELRTVCIIADEAKYHLSRPVLNGLGTARDKGVRVVVAFQSFADLRDAPDNLDADAVVGSFTENTPCKLVYRLEDPETAEWFAHKSGTKLVDDEVRQVDKNLLLTETVEGSGRTLRQMEAYYIDLNQLLQLPQGWAIAYGNGLSHGLAQPVKIGTYRVPKSPQALHVHVAYDAFLADTPHNRLHDLIEPLEPMALTAPPEPTLPLASVSTEPADTPALPAASEEAIAEDAPENTPQQTSRSRARAPAKPLAELI